MEPTRDPALDPLPHLRRLQERGTTTSGALEFFDSLAPATLDQLIGRWRGSGLPSGHPMDSVLEAFGWYGKEFIDPDTVHPLLFVDGAGEIVIVDSRHLPTGMIPTGMMTKLGSKASGLVRPLFSLTLPLFRTSEPRARIRMMEHRGKVSATMIYDFSPIHDVFRRVDDDTLLGLMDQRGMPQPFFFVLQRDGDSAGHV